MAAKSFVVVSARKLVLQITPQVGLHPICAIEQAALSARDAPMDVVSSNAAAIIVYFLNKLFTS